MKYLAAQKAEGCNPYPHKFFVSLTIPEYIEKYRGLSNGEHQEDVTESLAGTQNHSSVKVLPILFIFIFLQIDMFCYAGRIMSKRSSSSKLFFYDLHGVGAKVQVMADARCLIIFISYLCH